MSDSKALATFNSKEMLKKEGENGTKIKYQSRTKIELLKDTKHYKKGQIIEPHSIVAKHMIADKLAKKVVEKEDE